MAALVLALVAEDGLGETNAFQNEMQPYEETLLFSHHNGDWATNVDGSDE